MALAVALNRLAAHGRAYERSCTGLNKLAGTLRSSPCPGNGRWIAIWERPM